MADLLTLGDLAGVFFFGLSGSILAARLKLDIVASVIFAGCTGLGGGVVRDLLLQTEVAAVNNPLLLLPVLLAVLLVFIFNKLIEKIPRTIFVVDAFGLSLFSITGTLKALSLDFSPIAAILLGTITAVGGGVIRDTLANVTPAIFRRDEIYAIPAFLGATATALSSFYSVFTPIVAILIGVAVLALRLVTIWIPIQSPPASLWRKPEN